MTGFDFAQNFHQLHRLLFLYAMKQSRDTVISEHVVGDVIGRVFEKITVEGLQIRNLRAFLYTSVYNGVVDDHRRVQRQAPLDVVIEAHWLGSPQPVETIVERKVLTEELTRRIQRLSTLQRHVVVLRYTEGLSLEEVAKTLGLPKKTVKAAAARAMKNLRRWKNNRNLLER